MRIGVLTSSRADYGIYLPLLKAMSNDAYFDLRIIAFGTHLSPLHGYTIDAIREDGFVIDHTVEHILSADSEAAVATSMGLAFLKFASLWERAKSEYDLVFCLGDRYEMFAAVSAASPYRIRFAHIHGGETTLGAIDNEYRHCLSLFSQYHFTSTEAYANRVAEITGQQGKIFSVGSLSLDGFEDLQLLDLEEFRQRFSIDLSQPTILVTFHPETVQTEENEYNARELTSALSRLQGYQVVITMPNADTKGLAMRKVYEQYASKNANVVLVENLGTLGYFSCMKHSRLVVGNSSSGIIETASFGKYVIDIGDRQKGRAVSENIIHCGHNAGEIVAACTAALDKGEYAGSNIYYRRNVAQQIIQVLKNDFQ